MIAAPGVRIGLVRIDRLDVQLAPVAYLPIERDAGVFQRIERHRVPQSLPTAPRNRLYPPADRATPEGLGGAISRPYPQLSTGTSTGPTTAREGMILMSRPQRHAGERRRRPAGAPAQPDPRPVRRGGEHARRRAQERLRPARTASRRPRDRRGGDHPSDRAAYAARRRGDRRGPAWRKSARPRRNWHASRAWTPRLHVSSPNSTSYGSRYSPTPAPRNAMSSTASATNSSEAQRRGLAAAVKVAEAIAPTHPHPGVETATKHLLAGPAAATRRPDTRPHPRRPRLERQTHPRYACLTHERVTARHGAGKTGRMRLSAPTAAQD